MGIDSQKLENYYLILDIKRNSTQDEIEMAYAKMALKHHPDVAGDSPEVQNRFAKINKAYSVLSNPAKKQQYDELLGAPDLNWQQQEVITGQEASKFSHSSSSHSEEAETPVRKTRAPEAPSSADRMSRKKLDRIMSQSRKLISKGDFWRADAMLKQAAVAFPQDAEIRRMLAKAAEGRGRYREAVEDLKAAVEIEYFNPLNHCLMGKMFLKGDQTDRAERAFYDALSWQEDYEPALKGLKRIKSLRRKSLPWWKKLMGQGK